MLPVLICALACGGLLLAERRRVHLARAVTKPIAAGCFVWAALAWGALGTHHGGLVLAGLCLCWCGDVLLIPEGSPRWFQAGLVAFLLGHLVYAVAFLVRGSDLLVLLAVAPAVGLLALLGLRWLGPHLPSAMSVPVRAYVLVISAMVAFALASVGAGAPWLVGVGAIGCALSDVAVARSRFVAPGFVNAAWGLPLYFASQLLLAASVAA